MSRDFELSDAADTFNVADSGTSIDRPLTMAAWLKPESLVNGVVWQQLDTVGGDVVELGISPISMWWGPNSKYSEGSTELTVDVWNHCIWNIATGAQRFVLDGTVETGNRPMSAGTWGTPDKDISPTSSPYDGLIACLTVWDVALNTVEEASLAAGIHPMFIRHGNIVHHYEMDRAAGDDEPDFGSAHETMLQASSPAVGPDNPPLLMSPWSSPSDYIPEVAASGSLILPSKSRAIRRILRM
jgi:hypothetical protein